MKAECNHPIGLLQPIPILEWKCEGVFMDFTTSFPRTSRQHDSNMVVLNTLRKVAHFISVKSMNSASEVGQFFIKDIVRLHGVPKKIILDRDASPLPSFGRNCLQA